MKRAPDFVITRDDGTPYLRRWWIIPRNRFFNIYLHHIQGDDDDRALHDHPYVNVSVVLKGGYWEVMPHDGNQWRSEGDRLIPIDRGIWRRPGSIVFRRPTDAHRLELHREVRRDVKGLKGYGPPIPCWSLFITGPRVREWGFHCPKGWVPWQKFTSPDNKGAIGKGCAD